MIATRLFRAMALAGAAAIAWSGLPAAQATERRQPACGSLVTANVLLTADLVCSGDGLIVDGATGVTIDLGGFTLSGNGTGTGISIRQSTDVRVRHGSINTFFTAVSVASPATLVDLRFSGNTGPPSGYFVASDLIVTAPVVARRLTGTGSVFAAWHAGSVFNHVSFSLLFTRNASNIEISNSAIYGMFARDSFHLLLSDDVIHGAGVLQSDGLEFRDNEMTSLSVSQSRGTTVVNNVFRHGGVALNFNPYGTAANLIDGNLFEGNDVGVLLDNDGPTTTTVTNNRFPDNASAGLYAISRRGTVAISGNILNGNGLASTFVGRAGTLIDDGMHVVVMAGASATITGNTANRNADLGIQATDAIDGGANTAERNRNPAQCIGVACA